MDPLVLDGRYAVGETLGGGGMAHVHRGDDLQLQRGVAIKLLGDLSDAARRRLLREARLAARLTHPNVVRMLDVGADANPPYLVMELVPGETLAGRLTREGRLPIDEAVTVVAQILDGLAAAHGAGLLHRDIKPSNILLTVDGQVKIADFGIAKDLTFDDTSPLTMAGDVIGTPHYLAPERLAGDAAAPASDIYSVGVVLHEIVGGTRPFDGPTPMAVAVAHRDTPVPQLAADVPPELAAVARAAMAKDPRDRWESAAAMRAALLAAGNGRATPTRVLPVDGRRRRHRALIAGAVTVVLLGGAAAAFDRAGTVLASPSPDATAAEAAASSPATTAPAPTAPPATARPTTAAPAPAPQPADPSAAPDLAQLPTSLDELAAQLQEDPERYGRRGPDLFTLLESTSDKPKDIRKAAEKIAAWVEHGQLDSVLAAAMLEALGPIPGED